MSFNISELHKAINDKNHFWKPFKNQGNLN